MLVGSHLIYTAYKCGVGSLDDILIDSYTPIYLAF